MSLKQSSCPVDDDCVVCDSCKADLILSKNNSSVKPVLVKTKDKKQTVQVFWKGVEPNSNTDLFCPIFTGQPEDTEDITIVKKLKNDELFIYESNIYCVQVDKNNVSIIRRVVTLSSERMVRQVLQYYGKIYVYTIKLVNLYTNGCSAKYVTTAWSVYLNNGSKCYLPLFERDVALLDKYDLDELRVEKLKVNDVFCNNYKSYRLLIDEKGKLAISSSFAFKVHKKK